MGASPKAESVLFMAKDSSLKSGASPREEGVAGESPDSTSDEVGPVVGRYVNLRSRSGQQIQCISSSSPEAESGSDDYKWLLPRILRVAGSQQILWSGVEWSGVEW
jgi:hypothetical protein